MTIQLGNLAAALLLLTAGLRAGDVPVNADSVIIADFQKRVADYAQLRKGVEANLPPLKSSPSPARLSRQENTLTRAMREARKNSKQGDIFSPRIAMELRRLISIAMQPSDAAHIRQSLRHAEPVRLRLRINDPYPERVPLQSTPPSLLANLPRLPSEIEYRIIGADLILLDTKANLVVDILNGAFA